MLPTIVNFEEEFAAHIVLPDNSTVGEWLLPQIKEAYQRQVMPPMLGISASKTRDDEGS